MATITVYPSGYVRDDHAYKSVKGITNGYKSAGNWYRYATIEATAGGAETYFYYTFDLSELPPDVVITSVTCVATAIVPKFNSLETSTVQLYCSTNAKGSAVAMGKKVSVESGTWTRKELKDCRLKLYGKTYESSAATTDIMFYGATLTIEYAEAANVPIVGDVTIEGVAKELSMGYCNIDGVWKTIAKSYTNINGVWKPAYRIGDVVFKWKKYSVGTVKIADGWRYPGTGNYTRIDYTDSTAEFEIARKPDQHPERLAPTYGNNELISLDWGTVPHSTQSVGSTIVTDYTSTIPSDDVVYVKILNTAGWDTPVNPNYVYLNSLSSSGYNSDGTMKYLKLVTPIYNPTYRDVQGEYIEEVTSSDINAYPYNGIQDGYWYVMQ